MISPGKVQSAAVLAMVAVISAASWAEGPATQPATAASGTDMAPPPETITVTATRTETKLAQIGSDVSVVTAKDIENKKITNVADALRDLPGVTVTRSGGPGQKTSVFLRGLKTEHTLVMIDGVPANDPTTPGGEFDFARLAPDNVERIEVIRGPQSTLYGSNAMGGVVNIITKSGQAGKPTGYLSLEYGSYQTWREAAGVSGGTKEFRFSIAGSRTDTQGISAIAGGVERDGYHNIQGSVKLSLEVTEYLGFDLITRASDGQTGIDGFNNTTFTQTDLNSKVVAQEYYNRFQTRLALFEDRWQQKLGLSYNKIDRENITQPGFGDSTVGHDSFHGGTHRVDWQNDLYFIENNIFTFGLDAQEESAKTSSFSNIFGSSDFDTSRWVVGGYVQNQFRMLKPFYLTIGGRADGYETFGTALTYRIAPSLVIEQTDTTLKGSFGTGFKAPTLYQLFSTYGDRNLQPEKSQGWDVGFEQQFCKKTVTLGATYFYNDVQDLIDYSFATNRYSNVATATSQGIETIARWQICKDLSLGASYTYTHTRDNATGSRLPRRPWHAGSLSLDYTFLKKGHLNVGTDYTGSRLDIDINSFSPITNKDYWLVHAAASYDITENFQVFARVENPVNTHYQEVAGYASPGCNAYVGVKLKF